MTALLRIAEHAMHRPDHPALEVEGEIWTYGRLWAAVTSLAERLPPCGAEAPQLRIAVMAQRRASSYLGILAVRLAGHCYVPINTSHPPARSASVLEAAGAAAVICGDLASDTLDAILSHAPGLARIQRISCGESLADYPADAAPFAPTTEDGEALAYILFTSGSTGRPKGVPITVANLEAYLAAVDIISPGASDDRYSQTFDLTFDLSVHDLFASLSRGATLVVASGTDLRNPAAYIRDRRITRWFSVPSLAFQMRLQGDLTPEAFPKLRFVHFCGELLPSALAREWQKAAPQAQIENWYGPTEATIACTRYALGKAEDLQDDVPIGTAFPAMALHILDDTQAPCMPGATGDLWLSGTQLAQGYLDDPDRSAQSFVTLPDGTRAYKTGDRAVMQPDGCVRYLGRSDNQIKLRGYRIELGEVEAVLREVSGGANAVALPWPWGAASPSSILAAVEDAKADGAALRARLQGRLPDYMIPADVIVLNAFPRNASGKADRRGVAQTITALEGQARHDRLGPTGDALLAAILSVAPALSRARVLAADNLLDAGMDSLSFVALTMELERRFEMELDQDRVVRLSTLPFKAIVRDIESGATRSGLLETLQLWFRRARGLLHGRPRASRTRTRRALQFIHRLPVLLDEPGPPFVPVIGSSGVFRSVDAHLLDAEAARLGQSVRVINAGLPAVDPAGLRQVCGFVASEARARGLRFPLAIWEFDPMHVSTTPPSGDISLGPSFFQRRVIPAAAGAISPEFEWTLEGRGSWQAEGVAQQARRPNWARARDRVIAAVFQGGLDLDEARFAEWLAGAAALSTVTDRLVIFIHPADAAMLAEADAPVQPNRLEAAIRRIKEDLGVEVLRWQDFDLTPEDFLDINHVNATPGRGRLTRQLGHMLWIPG